MPGASTTSSAPALSNTSRKSLMQRHALLPACAGNGHLNAVVAPSPAREELSGPNAWAERTTYSQ